MGRALAPAQRLRTNQPALEAGDRRSGRDPGQPAGAADRAADRCSRAQGRTGSATRRIGENGAALSRDEARMGRGAPRSLAAARAFCRRRDRAGARGPPPDPLRIRPHGAAGQDHRRRNPSAGRSATSGRRVRNHLLGMAQAEISSRAYRLAASIGREVARVSVRDTKSRWGSCSRQGNLSFCWRLILAPELVLDQVVAHEVAHLVEMNHGPRFWRLVESLAPGGAGARAWLKQHRARLLSYG